MTMVKVWMMVIRKFGLDEDRFSSRAHEHLAVVNGKDDTFLLLSLGIVLLGNIINNTTQTGSDITT
jgi:hypothetical protein